MSLLFVSCILFILLIQVYSKENNQQEEYLHEDTTFQAMLGEREPGLWRPKFVIDREFIDKKGTVTKRDRVYFRLNPNRTVKIFHSSRRPFLEWKKKSKEVPNNLETKSMKTYFAPEEGDGSWDYLADDKFIKDERARLYLDLLDVITDERVRHELFGYWGTTDPYSVNFLEGSMTQFQGVKDRSDIPLGGYFVGRCTLHANGHRPLVSKDFLAFQ